MTANGRSVRETARANTPARAVTLVATTVARFLRNAAAQTVDEHDDLVALPGAP